MNELSTIAKVQANLYGLQSVVAAVLARHFDSQDDLEREGKKILNTALGSIAKFDLRGDATQEQKDITRAMMEAAATETVTAALQSARLRRQSGR